MASTYDRLDLVAQCQVCAYVLAGVASSFRAIDRDAMADQCLEVATWFHDLAHDLTAILEDKP